jgi:hypothetical protein
LDWTQLGCERDTCGAARECDAATTTTTTTTGAELAGWLAVAWVLSSSLLVAN